MDQDHVIEILDDSDFDLTKREDAVSQSLHPLRDDLVPADEDFRQDLQDCLDDMKHQGTFFSSNTSELYINPGL